MSETTKILGVLGLCLGILFVFWMIQGRMGCQTARQQNREERREERSKREKVCTLLRIDDGATLTVAWGRRDRGEKTVVIECISIPESQQSAAKANMEKLTAGNQVRVHYEVHRLFAAEAGEESLEETELESSAPIIGAVWGDGGLNLGVEQLRAGYAKSNSDATKEMLDAEKEAKKAKRGVWAVVEYVPVDELKPLSPDEFENIKAELRFGEWMKTHCETCKECTYKNVLGGFPEWEEKCEEAIAEHEKQVKK